MKRVELIPMGVALAGLRNPITKQIIKTFPITEKGFRDTIRRYVDKFNMFIVNASDFSWNPNY